MSPYRLDTLRRLALVTAFTLHLFAACWAETRTIDGSGNNLLDPLRGSAGLKFIRFGYGTDFGDLVGDQLKPGLPNPRTVSNSISAQTTPIPNSRRLSDWAVQWGQFLSHDLALTPSGNNGNLLSNGEIGNFDIPVLDPNDPIGPNPIPFNRSDYDPATGQLGPPIIPREQINNVTSYIDASQVYGSDIKRATALRTFVGGRLATSADGALPPLNTQELPNDDPFGLGPALYLAGDVRANEQPGLTATHALFIREHNRLTGLLQQQNNNLSDEQLYQLARRIVGAEIQAITYNEYLPAIMGGDAPRAVDYDYDPTANATITNSFATAFFRFGHSMQSSRLRLVNNDGEEIGSLGVQDAFFDPSFLGNDPENVALIMRGLASQVAQENDLLVIDDIRNLLFGQPGAGGLDLAALDIQRGRDHGLPSYNSLRSSYGLSLVTISEISSDPIIVKTLTDLYGSANNVDALVGALAEDHLPGSTLGELLTSTFKNQFERLRDGDRFFYVGDEELSQPDIAAVIDLDAVLLSDIIRWNSNATNIQDNVFFVVPEPSSLYSLLIGVVLACGLKRSPA